MEIIIASAVVILVAGYFLYQRADKNRDGKIDAVEAKAAVEEVQVVVQEAKAVAKKAAVKAKAASTRVGRAVARKNAAKKPATKSTTKKK